MTVGPSNHCGFKEPNWSRWKAVAPLGVGRLSYPETGTGSSDRMPEVANEMEVQKLEP